MKRNFRSTAVNGNEDAAQILCIFYLQLRTINNVLFDSEDKPCMQND